MFCNTNPTRLFKRRVGCSALDVSNKVLNKMLQLARDCIHRHQGVALVSAVLVAQGDDCIQLLLQLRRKAEVAGIVGLL